MNEIDTSWIDDSLWDDTTAYTDPEDNEITADEFENEFGGTSSIADTTVGEEQPNSGDTTETEQVNDKALEDTTESATAPATAWLTDYKPDSESSNRSAQIAEDLSDQARVNAAAGNQFASSSIFDSVPGASRSVDDSWDSDDWNDFGDDTPAYTDPEGNEITADEFENDYGGSSSQNDITVGSQDNAGNTVIPGTTNTLQDIKTTVAPGERVDLGNGQTGVYLEGRDTVQVQDSDGKVTSYNATTGQVTGVNSKEGDKTTEIDYVNGTRTVYDESTGKMTTTNLATGETHTYQAATTTNPMAEALGESWDWRGATELTNPEVQSAIALHGGRDGAYTTSDGKEVTVNHGNVYVQDDRGNTTTYDLNGTAISTSEISYNENDEMIETIHYIGTGEVEVRNTDTGTVTITDKDGNTTTYQAPTQTAVSASDVINGRDTGTGSAWNFSDRTGWTETSSANAGDRYGVSSNDLEFIRDRDTQAGQTGVSQKDLEEFFTDKFSKGEMTPQQAIALAEKQNLSTPTKEWLYAWLHENGDLSDDDYNMLMHTGSGTDTNSGNVMRTFGYSDTQTDPTAINDYNRGIKEETNNVVSDAMKKVIIYQPYVRRAIRGWKE